MGDEQAHPKDASILSNRSFLTRSSGFSAYYLGAVYRFMMKPNAGKKSEAQLISKIEEEQLDGKLKMRPSAKDAVRIGLDHHGFQISKEDSRDIIIRIPLHTLAQLVMYDDGFNKFNLAVKVIKGQELFSCHVLQCHSEEMARNICETLQSVFRAIMVKSDGSM